MGYLDSMLSKITEAYNKVATSNVGKLFSMVASELDQVKEAYDTMDLYRDIDNATGFTLDRIGVNIQQLRGQSTDEVYRVLLKSKIARNMSTGTIDNIIDIISVALDCEPTEITLREQYDDPDDPEPACISLVSMPIERLNAIGLSANTFAKIVNKMLSGGVRVGVIELEGTFDLSEDLEFDISTGLANDLQTTGGYLGEVYQPGEDPELPL